MAGDEGQRTLLVLSDGADTELDPARRRRRRAISERRPAGRRRRPRAERPPTSRALEQLAARRRRPGDQRRQRGARRRRSPPRPTCWPPRCWSPRRCPSPRRGTQGTVEVTLPLDRRRHHRLGVHDDPGRDRRRRRSRPTRGWSPPDWVMYAGDRRRRRSACVGLLVHAGAARRPPIERGRPGRRRTPARPGAGDEPAGQGRGR